MGINTPHKNNSNLCISNLGDKDSNLRISNLGDLIFILTTMPRTRRPTRPSRTYIYRWLPQAMWWDFAPFPGIVTADGYRGPSGTGCGCWLVVERSSSSSRALSTLWSWASISLITAAVLAFTLASKSIWFWMAKVSSWYLAVLCWYIAIRCSAASIRPVSSSRRAFQIASYFSSTMAFAARTLGYLLFHILPTRCMLFC